MRYRRDEHRSGGLLKKSLPWLIGGSAALWLFWPRAANAQPNNTTNLSAVVNSGAGAMRVRSGPGTNTDQIGDAADGTTVTVLQRGIAPIDGQGGEWWKIATATGLTGYVRGIDAQGNHNFKT